MAAYHCNEGAGSSLADVSGNGNNGTLSGGAAWSAAGRYGASLSFTANSQLVTIADSNSLDLTNGMTLESWVYPTGSTAWQTVVMKESPTGLAYGIYSRVSANRPGAYINLGGSDVAASSGAGLPLNTWSHVAATYDGAVLRLYVNGTLRTSTNIAGPLPATTNPLRIGGNAVWGEYFRGRIDEIRIYRRALTAAQIQADMAAPVSAAPSVTITTPTPGSTISGVVPVSATASSGQPVAGVQFKLDNANLGNEDTTAPYSINWDTSGASNGSHSLTAVVRDTAGGTATSAAVNVTVANNVSLPSITLTAPATGSTVSGTISVAATATDGSGIAGVQFLVDGSNLGAEDTTPPYSVNWNTNVSGDGSHTVSARARNIFGLTSTSNSATVTVANFSNPAVTGQWSAVKNWPLVSVNAVLLHTGKVLVYDRASAGPSVRVWDPVTEAFTSIPNNTTDLFCSGHAAMADGRILVVGGHGGGSPVGAADVNIFDPVALTWTLGPSMAFRRWYPTATMLADGRILVHTGAAQTLTDYVAIPEIYNPASNTWSRLNSAPLATPTYAQMYLLPNGKVANPGNYEAPVATRILDVATQTWTTVDPVARDGGSVMYEPGKVLKCGSSADSGFSGPSSRNCLMIDLNAATPAWQPAATMAYARAFHNMALLPDGTVLTTGGGTQRDGYYVENAVYHAELWSAATNTWTTLAPEARPRLYHSVSLLLPDGRVLSSGGGRDGPGIDQLNAEIFSPPYLFKGARPVITSAPDTVTYGSNFTVQTPDAANIAMVTLMRPGASTHAYDQEQRFQKLTFQQTAGGLTVQAPASPNLAPPGYHMLFLVNANGVPSVAKFVRFPLGSSGNPPSAPANLTASGAIGSIALSWTASSGPNGISNYNVHRSTTPSFVASAANRIAQPVTTSYTDNNLAAGRYYYVVTAQDVTQAVSGPSNEAFADSLADSTPPQVAMTAPTTTVVSGTITVSASATDDNGVAGVQFLLDGAALGSEVMSPPYSIQWNTVAASNGSHTLTARARDIGGNTTNSAPLTVTVSNSGPTGLVLAMAFNEGVGTTTEDRSGFSQSGLLSNTAWSPTGKFGGSLSFNGTNSSVSVNDSSQLDLTTGMTLMAWVQPAVSANWRTVILKETPGDLAYALYSSTDNGRPGGYFVTGSSTRELRGSGPLPTNTWTHLAVTYSGSVMTMYVNGAPVGTLNTSGSIVTSNSPLKIGGNAIWSEWFQGLIDEVRVYNRALSAAEVQSVMNTPIVP